MDHEYSSTYMDYYLREKPEILLRFQQDKQLQKLEEFFSLKNPFKTDNKTFSRNENIALEKNPPDIFLFLKTILSLNNFSENESIEILKRNIFSIAYTKTKKICKIYNLLLIPDGLSCYNISNLIIFQKDLMIENFVASQNLPLLTVSFGNIRKNKKISIKNYKKNPCKACYLYLVKKKLTLEKIESLPIGISTLIFEVLRIIRISQPFFLFELNLPKLAFHLIKRQDLYKNCKNFRILTKEENKNNSNFSELINKTIRGESKCQNASKLFISQSSDLQKLNNDFVFKEVERILGTTKLLKIKGKYLENIPEDRFDQESQQILQKYCIRRLSCFIGQGSFSLGSVHAFMTDVLKIPKICLSGIAPPDIKISLDLKEEKDQNLCNWPEFHNGVATGLKLSREIMGVNPIHLRTWIFYQKPETPKYDHGGFLLAMGLLGYLDSFVSTDIYQYLLKSHDGTAVGLLLGLSAARLGKMDESTSKTLCLHIPSLLPKSYDVEIQLIVTTAAIAGLGLLYQGTGNRKMTELALTEIGRKPFSDKCIERDCYSLAAGYALGLINLGKGTNNPIIKDLSLEERLIRLVEGGKPFPPPQTMLSSSLAGENRCSSIREGTSVNTHITAPAALVALSLIFLDSNNEVLASQISIPNTFATLEAVNPNHILMKILTKNLIMWDKIENTQEFIYKQIPELIRFIYENQIKQVQERYHFIYNVDEIDFDTVTLVYNNIIAGALLSIGFKYAGTKNEQALLTILNEIEKFRILKVAKSDLVNDPAFKNAIDQYNLFNLLSVSLLALSLVMSGSCDQRSLKICRIIRKKIQDTGSINYGFNMAINMAIGFICLGYGTYSFTRTKMSIAALLISVYPHFPTAPTDNKYHLQALRHFYVLATEQNVFHAVEIKEKKPLHIQIEMTWREGVFETVENVYTPVLLQDSKKLINVKVISFNN